MYLTPVYFFYDPEYKHPTPKWWHIINIVTCYNCNGGVGWYVPVYKVWTLRIFWIIPVLHFVKEHFDD